MEEGSAYDIFSTGGRPGNSNDTYFSVRCSWGLLSASAVTRDVGSLPCRAVPQSILRPWMLVMPWRVVPGRTSIHEEAL